MVFLHFPNTLGNRFVVSQHAAQPALVHIGHAALFGKRLDGRLGLTLCPHEQDHPISSRHVPDEGVGPFDAVQCLFKVNDVNPRTFPVDEPLHPRVPATGLVTKVNPGL